MQDLCGLKRKERKKIGCMQKEEIGNNFRNLFLIKIVSKIRLHFHGMLESNNHFHIFEN